MQFSYHQENKLQQYFCIPLTCNLLTVMTKCQMSLLVTVQTCMDKKQFEIKFVFRWCLISIYVQAGVVKLNKLTRRLGT